ncbi:MAG: iron ABC transporter permease [Planctomycetes bacterium]|nr:iron ABC transporter permease [Planctomycetota bacterium]
MSIQSIAAKKSERRSRRALAGLIAVSSLIVLAATAVQTAAGSYGMSWHEALAALADAKVWGDPTMLVHLVFGKNIAHALGLGDPDALSVTTLVVWNVRLPRVLVGIMVGINLAYSGCIFQAITRNELASPYLLGVSSGAGLAIILVLVFFPVMGVHMPLIAMLGGGAAFFVVYLIAWNRGTSPVRLVLAGVIVGAIAGSLQTAIFFFIKDVSVMQNAMSWTTGSLTGCGWEQVRLATPWTILCVVLGLSASRYLDVLLLGDPMAKALGMPVERVRFLLAATAILAAGAAVSVAGLIGFVGLIVPHIVRSVTGSSHRMLLVGCLFSGPALLTSADAAARLALNPVQIPVGIVTGILGGVFFLYLMRRKQEIGKL